MYLYVLKADALERVPEPLMAAFGKAIHAFDLVLTPERKLSREDIAVVLENLRNRVTTCKCHRPKTNTSSTCLKSCCVATTRCNDLIRVPGSGTCPEWIQMIGGAPSDALTRDGGRWQLF
jgi:hypothetical protein